MSPLNFGIFKKQPKKEAEKPNVEGLINVILNDKSDQERYNAAVRLGNLRDARAIPHLFNAANDPKDHSILLPGRVVYIQVAATEALGEIGGAEAVVALSKLIRSHSGGVFLAAVQGLKKLGASDVLQRYYRFKNQSWSALILDEDGNIVLWEYAPPSQGYRQIGPGNYTRLEYAIADVEAVSGTEAWEGIPVDAEIKRGSIPIGIVGLEARTLRLEEIVSEYSLLDLAGEEVKLNPSQRRAFVDFYKKTYYWFRPTREVSELLS